MQNKLYAKLTRSFLRKWWFVIIAALGMLVGAFIVLFFFSTIVNFIIDKQILLVKGSQTYDMWRKPPVHPVMQVYVYNVTNADEFLNDGHKPVLQELGPYVYEETWEKVNLIHHANGTLTFNQKKVFRFDRARSAGSDEDMVIVPNIPMLSATSQSKHAARFLRLAMASIMDILKVKPFVEVSVDQLLWGYDDPLLKLAKDVVPKEQKLPYEEFGLLYGKNATSADNVTIFTGEDDITRFGLVSRFNGKQGWGHWKTDECNRIDGSDGSVFPPHMNHNTTLYVYDKDLCRLLPLTFQKEVKHSGVRGFRFTPSKMALSDVSVNPENECFCPSGPPCTPPGMFNVSLCQYDSPVLLSFPHFYMGDDKLRTAVEGISPPDPEKHEFYIDVQPDMGVPLQAKGRFQVNLAVSQVVDIKQVATFPDIVFPIIWFEDGIERLPDDVYDLLRLGTETPPVAKVALLYVLFIFGSVLLVVSVFCLVRSSNRQEIMNLEGTAHYAANDEANKKKKAAMNGHSNGRTLDSKTNPAFMGDDTS